MSVTPMPDSELRAGKIFEAAVYPLVARSVASLDEDTGDGVATYGHTAQGETAFTPDTILIASGIFVQASSGFDGDNGSWEVYYQGPGAPLGVSFGDSGYRSDVSAEVRLINLKLYVLETGAILQIKCDSIELYANGDLKATFGGIDLTSAGVGPNYIPILGMPWTVSGSCSAGRAHLTPWVYDRCSPELPTDYDYTTSVSSQVSGGWRWNDGTTWYDCPVTPWPGTVPAERTYGDLFECQASVQYEFEYTGRDPIYQDVYVSCGKDGTPTFVGTFQGQGIDSCTGELVGDAQDVYRTEVQNESKVGTVTLIPDLSPEFKRFALGYAKLLRRLWFPATKGASTHTEQDTVGSVTTTTTTGGEAEVHPGLGNDFLGLVRDVDVPLFDCFDTPPYAPASMSHDRTRTVSFQPQFAPYHEVIPGPIEDYCPGGTGSFSSVQIPNVYDDENHFVGDSAAFPTYVGPSGDYQGHSEPLARYLATWPHPFWHLFSHRQDWYLQGTDVPWEEYWALIRTQMLRNDAIPGLPSTRSDMIGDPYYDWFAAPFFDEFTGGLPWLGISRFKVREVLFPELVQLTAESEPMLSCPDDSCEVSVSGSSIVLTPSGSGPITLDIDLVRADCFPYYGLLLAKTVRFTATSNVDGFTASLRSSLGGSVALNDGNPLSLATDYEFPRGQDSGYAGTWGSESGAGYLEDVGTDAAPGGQSVAKMGNAETLVGFQGVRGKQGSVLRLTIEPSGDGDVTLSLPLFKRFQGHPEVRWLDGNKALMFWPNGPAVLWGAHLTYVPDEGLYWPWLPKGLGTPNTLADALQFIYAVFEMTDPGDVPAFNAECNAWYDDYEVSLRNAGSADKFSFSMLLPKGSDDKIRFAIAQTIAEVPPLACFPTLKREATDWKADGDPAMERWDRAQETRYIVSPVTPLVLKAPGGSVLSTSDSAPAGWAIQKYALSLAGDEANDYRLDQGGTTFATLYPWHGWDWVGQARERVTGGVANLHTPDGRYWVAYATDAGIVVKTALLGGPTPDWHTAANATMAEGDANPCLSWDPQTGRGYLVFDREGEIYGTYSDSMGETWSEPAVTGLIPGGRIPRLRHTYPDGDRLIVAVVDDGGSGAGKLVGRFRWRGDTEYGDPFDLKIHPDSSIDPDTVFRLAGDADQPAADYDVYPGRTSDGRWSLTIVRDGDDGPTEWFSTNDAHHFKPA